MNGVDKKNSEGDRQRELPTGSTWRRAFSAAPYAVVLLCVALAVAAPWISPQQVHQLETLRLEDSNLPPAWSAKAVPAAEPGAPRFWLGTDIQGRDMLSAIFFGLRVSLLVGVAATALAMTAGVALGLAAGYWRGWFETAVMRLADVQLSFPSMLIAIFLMAILKPGVGKIIFAVALAHWVIYARTVRGAALAEREKDYIAAERALGAGPLRIMLRHLLPNLLNPILVISAVEFSSVVMLEATLSFLGLGTPPERPSLGTLINAGFRDFYNETWWTWVFPGLALVVLVYAVNVIADRLRDRLSGDQHS